MKKIILYLVTAGLICCNYACNKDDPSKNIQLAKPIDLTLKQGEKTNADNRFAFSMFKEISALNGSNTFFSPLSLNMALGMLYNGASGDTRMEMAEVLGMADFTDTEINEYYQKMSQALLNIDQLTEIAIANSIWYRHILSVKQPFIDVNQKYFDAEVKAIDFSKPDAARIINQWCADKTKNKIMEIIQSPIDGDIMMYLINALYFKSKWESKFDKSNTKRDYFTKTDKLTVMANLMEQTAAFPYYADQYLQCVELPYGNQAFSMVAILPGDEIDINQLIDYLDDAKWQNVVNNLSERQVWLKLPRFKVECELPLNEPVQYTGMKRIFDGFFAEFAHISDTPLCVSEIKQKTFVEVNEEGTEAAAVTVIGMIPTAAPIFEPVQFFASRPFLYLIKEKSTGAILFIGRMDEPIE